MSSILKKAKQVGSSVGGAILPIGFGLMEYNSAREQGKSVLGAATQAIGSEIFWDSTGFLLGTALTTLPALPKTAINIGENLSSMSRSMNRGAINTPFSNATFVDTQQTYTMRQAGMQMAQASRYNLQQTLLGNEAQYMKL